MGGGGELSRLGRLWTGAARWPQGLQSAGGRAAPGEVLPRPPGPKIPDKHRVSRSPLNGHIVDSLAKVCAGRIRTNVPTPGYNIQSLFRILPQHTVALRCAKTLELPQNGFLRGNHRWPTSAPQLRNVRSSRATRRPARCGPGLRSWLAPSRPRSTAAGLPRPSGRKEVLAMAVSGHSCGHSQPCESSDSSLTANR